MPSTIHVGLVGWHSLPAIFSDDSFPTERAIGGGEVRMWTLAKSLASRPGLRVTMFASSPDRPASGSWPNEVDNVRLIVSDDRIGRIRRAVHNAIDFRHQQLRRFHPSLLWQLPFLGITRPYRKSHLTDCRPDSRLRGHSVDVFLGFGNNAQTSRAVATAAAEGSLSIVSLQANSDVDQQLATNEHFENELGDLASTCRWTFDHADQIVCQSDLQAERLTQYFGRQGIVIRNPVDLKLWQKGQKKVDEASVVWIGRLHRKHKRPMMMVELARQIPEIPVLMIANHTDPSLEAEIRARQPANLQLIDYVPFEEMPQFLSRARLIVFTGHPDWEGFPNVMLQAAAAHTPIVSAFDFDSFLRKSGAGVAAGDSIENLAAQVRRLWKNDPIEWANVDNFLQKRHALECVTNQWETAIRSAVAGLHDGNTRSLDKPLGREELPAKIQKSGTGECNP